jgi:CelD/BcsL family acetyltransferase involved in cellulose biosynthesis
VRYLTQILDLDGGFDTVWSKRYKKKTRWEVRKAERCSLEIRRDHGGNALDVFAGLYRQAVDRWAHRSGHPLWVARLLERHRNHAGRVAAASAALGKTCVIWSAHRAGEPVAVNVVLQYGQHSILWLAAVNRELAQQTMAGHLLQSMAIEYACQSGARYFHMGESEPDSGVEQYKASFGATPVQYQALRFERLPVTNTQQRLHATVKRMTNWRTNQT